MPSTKSKLIVYPQATKATITTDNLPPADQSAIQKLRATQSNPDNSFAVDITNGRMGKALVATDLPRYIEYSSNNERFPLLGTPNLPQSVEQQGDSALTKGIWKHDPVGTTDNTALVVVDFDAIRKVANLPEEAYYNSITGKPWTHLVMHNLLSGTPEFATAIKTESLDPQTGEGVDFWQSHRGTNASNACLRVFNTKIDNRGNDVTSQEFIDGFNVSGLPGEGTDYRVVVTNGIGLRPLHEINMIKSGGRFHARFDPPPLQNEVLLASQSDSPVAALKLKIATIPPLTVEYFVQSVKEAYRGYDIVVADQPPVNVSKDTIWLDRDQIDKAIGKVDYTGGLNKKDAGTQRWSFVSAVGRVLRPQ